MYRTRLLSRTFLSALEQFPAVMVTGPRQAGKTTFLLHERSKGCAYASFDDPLERSFATSDPNGFLDRFEEGPVILDEVQYVPEILPYLKMRIDQDRNRNGKWILTGSQQFHLMSGVTESLAGRVAILELLPFSLPESGTREGGLSGVTLDGGYPEVVFHPEKRDLWLRSYVQTYIERDVRSLRNITDIRSFELFLGLLASRHAQEFNGNELARNVGHSLPTIKSWTGVLEASYLIFMLPPYFRNFGKRLIKSPKLYFIDPALACYLTRQTNGEAALSGPMGGPLFEGLIVSEAVKMFASRGMRPGLFFWRSNDGLEVDLILRIGTVLYPVEIKLTATPTVKHVEPMERFLDLAKKSGEECRPGLLVCRAPEERVLPGGHRSIPWQGFSSRLWEMLSEGR